VILSGVLLGSSLVVPSIADRFSSAAALGPPSGGFGLSDVLPPSPLLLQSSPVRVTALPTSVSFALSPVLLLSSSLLPTGVFLSGVLLGSSLVVPSIAGGFSHPPGLGQFPPSEFGGSALLPGTAPALSPLFSLSPNDYLRQQAPSQSSAAPDRKQSVRTNPIVIIAGITAAALLLIVGIIISLLVFRRRSQSESAIEVDEDPISSLASNPEVMDPVTYLNAIDMDEGDLDNDESLGVLFE
jgi:hypothetical protein